MGKNGKNIPNNHKIYQMATKYTKGPQTRPNGRKLDQMAAKYTNIFKNLPKLGLWV
jgi:hypothetical protein